MDEPVDQVVYELWSDEDMRWVELGPVTSAGLELFIEMWCEKNDKIFRKRPRYVHAVDTPF